MANYSNAFQVNQSLFYADNEYVKKNSFLNMEAEDAPLPVYEEIKHLLPKPIWAGHEDTLACYDKTWELAFDHLRKPNPEAGFVSNFIDTAFHDHLFMWDSSFIPMYGRYASHVFNFQKTLDNMYSHQHKDGFICRELYENVWGEIFQKDDPASTGPNIMAWSEWEYYQLTGDKERVSRVFYPLLGYHKWLQLNRTWRDGSYWSSGLGCGMDNQPRVDKGYSELVSHGHAIWVDACFQMIISGKCLIEMGKVLGLEEDTRWLEEEVTSLSAIINDQLWSEEEAFYFDRWKNGLSGVKIVGSYWGLLADIIPAERLPRFIDHLNNPKEFNRPHRIPTLSADHPDYSEDGSYWKGSVWAPTNYMVLRGLEKVGYHDLAHEIACNSLENVVKVYLETDTLWENYSSEHVRRGLPSKPNFVGWTGLIPIASLFEYIFGILADIKNDEIVWRIKLTDEHGIERYPYKGHFVTLKCAARKNPTDEPMLTLQCDTPVKVHVVWDGGEKILYCEK